MGPSEGTGAPDGTTPAPAGADEDGLLRVRSFVVRALLEREDPDAPPGWHGLVTDTSTGARRAWRRPSDVARFIDGQLTRVGAASVTTGVPVMATPALTDVVADMLALLTARLPASLPALPAPNVTLEHVRERLVGLGNHRGSERAAVGVEVLRGGRLDAGVRFQLWATSANAVDDAVLGLHTDLLDDRDPLRLDGFLKLVATHTSLSEHVPSVGAWRKTASYDVLYEYRYRDTDEADSLIARIAIDVDQEASDSESREVTTVTDELVRWDDETTPELHVRGPLLVHRLSAAAFVPGPTPGGSITVRRTHDGAMGPPVAVPDLASLLAAVGGDPPAERHAEVTVPPTAFLAALGPASGTLALGDWDVDGNRDTYDLLDLAIDPPVRLTGPADRLEVAYGTTAGLDQPAVIYLRVNAP
jgi:hypothetical protein